MTENAKRKSFTQLVKDHFQQFLNDGHEPNEAAARALRCAEEESNNQAAVATPSQQPATPAMPSATGVTADAGASRYGPLCLGLAGPFQSICVTGQPRLGKRLLVLDIDHTIYDPSNHEGSKGSVVKSNASGFYDESVMARCRPGLHEFLTEAYMFYDIMVWSASDMIRILTLLQQLGIVGAGHSDYSVVAVLDIDSMSNLSPTKEATSVTEMSQETEPAASDACHGKSDGALVQVVRVPQGALPGQQIDARSITDGSPIVVTVPPGLSPGDEFHVTIPGAVSSMSEEMGLDAEDVQLALRISMGQVEDESAGKATSAALPNARKMSSRVKPLSLIWACHEFSPYYSEKNTVIVDDTVDVCVANRENSIRCTKYFWRDHATDKELERLKGYLDKIAKAEEFPKSHENWREGLS